jgi:hypothetical protein
METNKRWLFLLCSACTPPTSYGLGNFFKARIPIKIEATFGSIRIRPADEVDLHDPDALWIRKKGTPIRVAWADIDDVVLEDYPWRSHT